MEPNSTLTIPLLVSVGGFLALFSYLRYNQKQLDKQRKQIKKERRNDFGLGKGAELDGYVCAGYKIDDDDAK